MGWSQRLAVQQPLDAIAVHSCTFLEYECTGSLYLLTVVFVINTACCLSLLEIPWCSHLGNICLPHKATRTQTFSKKLDAGKDDSVVLDINVKWR